MVYRRHNVWLLCLIAAGLVFTIAGCGNGKLVTVEGTVTVGGKPADDGSITFAPADGLGPSVGTQVKNGTYRFTGSNGLTPGPKNVEITAMLKTGKKIEAGPPLRKGTMIDEAERFSSRETCDVSAGQANQFNFDLKPAPKK